MPSVLGVLEERERVALARAEELRVELERMQGAVAEAEEAARRAVIAREEVTDALAGVADGTVAPDGPAASGAAAPVPGGRRAAGRSPVVAPGVGA